MPPIYLAPFFPHSQLKMWGNGAKQMGKHSTGFIPQCGLTLLILLIQVQLKLFSSCFLFFPPVEADSSLASPDCEELNEVEQFCKNCETQLHSSEPDVIQDICPHFISGIFPTAVFITWRGKQSFPLQPPTHLKCSFLGLRLGVKAIRATHTQARTIIT